MAFKEPESMDECFYFTNRTFDNSGYAIAWIYKPDCPKCKKAKMGKPIKKNGKVDKKALIYECPACKHQVNIEEYEPTLNVQIKYKCPECGNEGETTAPFKRKKFKGVDAYVFQCTKCKLDIPLTKKMKDIKKKAGKEAAAEDADVGDE